MRCNLSQMWSNLTQWASLHVKDLLKRNILPTEHRKQTSHATAIVIQSRPFSFTENTNCRISPVPWTNDAACNLPPPACTISTGTTENNDTHTYIHMHASTHKYKHTKVHIYAYTYTNKHPHSTHKKRNIVYDARRHIPARTRLTKTCGVIWAKYGATWANELQHMYKENRLKRNTTLGGNARTGWS